MATPRFGAGRPGTILIHGYGADGDDLAPLAGMLPGTVLVPTAEDRTPHGGRQWWPIDDGGHPGYALVAADAAREPHAGVAAATTRIHGLVDELVDELPDGPVLLAGFSQGAMLALAAGLADPRVRVIVAMSGALTRDAAALAAQAAPRRILVAHGRQDPIVPYAAGEAASRILAEAGHDVEFIAFDGGHGVPPHVAAALAEEARRLAPDA